MILDPLFYAAAVPAVLLLGLSKGGFYGLGLLTLPLMALVAPPLQSAAVLLPLLIVQDVVTVFFYRRALEHRVLAIMLPGALVGIAAGAVFASRVPDAAIALLIGLVSVGFALRRLRLERMEPPPPNRGRVAGGLFWGAASGFASMVAQAGGPPFQIWVLPMRLPRDVLVGTSSIFFAALNWAKVVPFVALGQLDSGTLGTSALLMPLAVLSTWLGIQLVRRVPAERFYPLIYSLLALVGLKLLWDGGRGLLAASW